MKTYCDLVRDVLAHGVEKSDRTGVGVISLFGMQKRYDLRQGFPLLTTKKINFSAIVRELLWFLRGSTNINDDLAQYTPIWNAWADANGDLGPIYGYQWRKWEKFYEEKPGNFRKGHIDQIHNVLTQLRTTPHSRRMIVTAWNPADISKMALPPCHSFFQLSVSGNRLDLQLYQRSADIALGVPYNIASYSILLTLFAQEAGYEPGFFIHTLGDAHIYLNHKEALLRQMEREPYPLPRLLVEKKPFDSITYEDITLTGYTHHPFIFFPVAV